MTFKYTLLIAYDGTRYGGWQIQCNAPSIQATIENVLGTILQKKISITGSGRTDAGVHALGQVAHFATDTPIALHKTFASLNSLLPPDIRILALKEAPASFHARYSAKGKIYRYYLHLAAVRNPFVSPFSYHPPYPVDRNKLKEAAAYFIGTHNFTSFAHQAHTGVASYDPVRTLLRLDIVEQEELFYLEFEADGFLYKMVRNITGTLLDVACGKFLPDDIPLILKKEDRKKAGHTAPPQGLFLVCVHYPEEFSFFHDNRSPIVAPSF